MTGTLAFSSKRLQGEDGIFLNEKGFLDFRPGDPEHPHNWSFSRRSLISLATVLLVINASFASSSPTGCLPSMVRHFHISQEAAVLTATVFLLGYCAGPFLWAPLSEFYGRRWIFYGTFSAYVAFNFLCAFTPNFCGLLVGRFLTGTSVSAALSNSPGLLADIWNPLERGNAMALFVAMVWIGPALGPVVAGFLELKKDWKWSFYVLLWLGGFTMITMLLIPETHAPTILLHKAKRIRAAKILGYENVKAPVEEHDRSLVGLYRVALTRPWIILFDPISLLCSIYMAVDYTLLYMLFVIYPIVFQGKRGWNSGVGELPLIGTVCGAALGSIMTMIDTHLRMKKIKSGERALQDFVPEDRLPLATIGGIGFAITMFWFAWTAQYDSIHWIVPTLAGVFLSTSMLLVFVGYMNYLVDVYLMYAASAIAVNTVVRSAAGSAAPLFTNQMFSALGIGGGGSLIGGIATILAIIPFLFYKYGVKIRTQSRFSPTKPNKPLQSQETGQNTVEDSVQMEQISGDSSTLDQWEEEDKETATKKTAIDKGVLI